MVEKLKNELVKKCYLSFNENIRALELRITQQIQIPSGFKTAYRIPYKLLIRIPLYFQPFDILITIKNKPVLFNIIPETIQYLLRILNL